jgi:hypothetical protein
MNGQINFIFKGFLMKKLSSKFSLLYSPPLIKAAAFLTCIALSEPVFAQDAIAKMTSVADKVLAVFTGPLVRAILAIALCASAVVFATNKDNEKVKKGAFAVGIAGVIIAGASTIVSFFMD